MTNKPQSILIIGGVAGGATAAARLRRLDESAAITIIEKGPFVSFANCGLPYFISRDIQRRSSLLLQTPEGFLSRYNVSVMVNSEATAIRREEKVVVVRTKGGEEKIPYDKLVLAQGGTPTIPQIPGADCPQVFKLWTIPDMDRIHKFIEERKPSDAVIVGGGFVGLEMAEALTARGIKVSIVEFAPQLMVSMDREFGAMIESHLDRHGVKVLTGRSVVEISHDTVALSDGCSIKAGIVLLSIGVRPELALAKAADLEIGASGGLVVDETMRTSDPDIYAAGDMVEIVNKVHGRKARIPLAGPANRQGRIAATNILGNKMRYHGAVGTSVVKLFDYTAASTGLSEKVAREAGFDVGAAYVFKDDHVSYYPGGKQLALKITYDRKTSRLLGGQAFGEAGVEKRIDVLATALQGEMTLEDLAELDLAYAPPYNSANDPINIAAFVGLNDISGFSPLKTSSEALDEIGKNDGTILDVRTVGEAAKAACEGAIHIPADEIRDRLHEIPANKPIYILSKDGFLGHTTLRILSGKGWKNAYNITGGYLAARWNNSWKFKNENQ